MASRAEAGPTGSGGSEDANKAEPVFKDLQAEDTSSAPTEIESMCVNCGQNVSIYFSKKTILKPKRGTQNDHVISKPTKNHSCYERPTREILNGF